MSAESSSPFNLQHLRKDAKRRLRACRAGDAAAIAFVRDRLAGMRRFEPGDVARSIRLSDMHQALAIDRGFSSWGDLTRFGDPVARLLVAVRGHHLATLRRDLSRFKDLARANVFAASSLGHAEALRQILHDNPSLAVSASEGWTPLDYVCSSPVARLSTRHATGLGDCADLLLAAGANPSTAASDERIPGKRLPAIVRALLSGNAGLMAVLKRGGAEEPHETIRQELLAGTTGDAAAIQESFRDYFRRPDVRAHVQTTVEQFKADGKTHPPLPSDPRELQHLRMPNLIGARQDLWTALLDRGFDPAAPGATGRTALHTLVTYAPASFVETVLARGVKVDRRAADGESVMAAAVRAGNREVADLLLAREVPDDSTPMDALIGRCLADDAEGAKEVLAGQPSLLERVDRRDADELVRAAARGAVAQVRLLLACGFPPDVVGEAGATALQMAAWRGQVPMVERLLAHGASPMKRDELYGETARGWAEHGASHAQGAEEPCRAAARLLEAAERRRA